MSKSTRNRQARERLAAARRAEQARRRRRQRLLAVGAVVVALALVGGITALVVHQSRGDSTDLAGVKSYREQAAHVEGPVKYPQTPPAGGPHNPTWLNCGIYPTPVPNENAVHDLEHGAVWITYRPGLPASQVAKLRTMVRGQTFLTLSPFPNLPAPVVASAWGKQLRLTGAGDPRLPKFIQTYRLGPQTPERGAPCTGGTGDPQ